MSRSEGSSSGGYLSFIMRFAVSKLYGIQLSPEDIDIGQNGIKIIPGRNLDFKEVSFTPPNQTIPTLRFAYCYGFKNLQTIIRKIKQLKSRKSSLDPWYNYIEVMACPSGCINGGGQLKPESDESNLEWIKQAQQKYYDDDITIRRPEANIIVSKVYSEILTSEESVQQVMHTQYHDISNAIISNGLAVTW